MSITAETTLPATPQTAFALALDAERFPELFTGFGPIPGVLRVTPGGPPAVGATRALENTDGSCLTERITLLEPPHRHHYTLSGLRAPLSWLARAGYAEWTFTATPVGARVVWRYGFELTNVLVWPLAAPLLHFFMRAAMQRCLTAMTRTFAPNEGNVH